MNNEMVTYTVMKNYVMGNWELTFISLKENTCEDVNMYNFFSKHRINLTEKLVFIRSYSMSSYCFSS